MSFVEFLDRINTELREDKTELLEELVKNCGIAFYFADNLLSLGGLTSPGIEKDHNYLSN